MSWVKRITPYARNTWEETVDFIVKDLDEAATLLDGKTLAAGRASKAAALALKSRILTYAASDLHDIPTAKAKSSVIAAYYEARAGGLPDR